MCIAGFICSLLSLVPIGILLCVIGLSRTKTNGKRGRRLAAAGIVIAILWLLFLIVRGVFALTAPGKGMSMFKPKQEKIWLPDELKQSMDEDTRIILLDYPALEEDIENFDADPMLMGTDEEFQKAAIRSMLQGRHLRDELTDAIAKQEKKVCVVGSTLGADAEGYINAHTAVLGSGEFRQLPYSSFWMRDYEILFAGSAQPEGKEMQFYSLYAFDYYGYSEEKIAIMKSDIDSETESYLSLIPAGADCWEKSRILHDELIEWVSYDENEGDHCHDLYGALVNYSAVCEGYSLAFKYLMEKAGERCEIIQGEPDAGDPQTAHAWNEVYCNSEERYIDVTWDDPDMWDQYYNTYIMYDYFGLTKEEVSRIDSHAAFSDAELEVADPEPFNYYRHQGYLFSEVSDEDIHAAFSDQLMDGLHLLTVRFDNSYAYEEAKEMWENGNPVISEMFQNGELPPDQEDYWQIFNDDLMICSVGIGKISE